MLAERTKDGFITAEELRRGRYEVRDMLVKGGHLVRVAYLWYNHGQDSYITQFRKYNNGWHNIERHTTVAEARRAFKSYVGWAKINWQRYNP